MGSIKYLFKPAWWFRVYQSSEELDLFLNKCVDDCVDIDYVSKFECKVGGVKVWIANHPYGSCSVMGLMPKRATQERFFNYVLEYRLKKALSE